jgi:hypothetical protein
MTALALAALNGRRDVCTFLIECYDLAPDEIDHVDSCGMAAFDHAVYGKNHDIAIYLFNHGANIALYDMAMPKNRLSTLHYLTIRSVCFSFSREHSTIMEGRDTCSTTRFPHWQH